MFIYSYGPFGLSMNNWGLTWERSNVVKRSSKSLPLGLSNQALNFKHSMVLCLKREDPRLLCAINLYHLCCTIWRKNFKAQTFCEWGIFPFFVNLNFRISRQRFTCIILASSHTQLHCFMWIIISQIVICL